MSGTSFDELSDVMCAVQICMFLFHSSGGSSTYLIVVVNGPIKNIPDEQAGMTILHIVHWVTKAYVNVT